MSTNTADLRAWEILKRLPWHNPVGVEVGVFRGALSWRLLASRDDLTLHMVDAWGLNQAEAFKASGDYHAGAEQDEHDAAETNARKITDFAEERRHVIKALSVDAAKQFADGSLDFVFLDGDHSEAGVWADLLAWESKVRPGGWICGHDYANDEFAFGPMVKRAVDAYALESPRVQRFERGVDFTWFMQIKGDRKAERLPWDVTVACVKQGTKYDARYVNILRRMVGKNLHKLHRFVCLTDDPEGLDEGIEVIPLTENLPGWWSKLELFKPEQFEGRVLYLDLDVVVTGALDPLAETDGIIKDWHLPGYNSSVMAWCDDEWRDVWDKFSPKRDDWMRRLRGDQDFMNLWARAPHFPADWCVSHVGTEQWPPPGARVVCFHGAVKPHMKPYPWVELMWSEDGMGCVEFTSRLTESREQMFANVRENLKRGLPMLKEMPQHDRTLCIVGGGPSLKNSLATIKAHEMNGAAIWSLNNAAAYLHKNNIISSAQVIADSRPEMAEMVAYCRSGEHLISSTCSAEVFKAIERFTQWDITLWTPDMDSIGDVLKDSGVENMLMVGGGPTVGLKAMCIGLARGFRHFELFGFDSSYDGDDDHAYPQPLNAEHAKERIDVWVDGRKFSCAPWMYRQAQAFQPQAKAMAALGCTINVHGDGLIPWLARAMAKPRVEISDAA